MKYTLDTLKKINERFIESHRMKESDVEMAILILYGIGMSQGKTSWR